MDYLITVGQFGSSFKFGLLVGDEEARLISDRAMDVILPQQFRAYALSSSTPCRSMKMESSPSLVHFPILYLDISPAPVIEFLLLPSGVTSLV